MFSQTLVVEVDIIFRNLVLRNLKKHMQWFCAATQAAVARSAHATLQLEKLFVSKDKFESQLPGKRISCMI